MKKTKQLLSFLVALSVIASTFVGLSVVSFADGDQNIIFEDNFNSYSAQTMLTQGTASTPATSTLIPGLTLLVGNRGNGSDNASGWAIATKEDGDNYLSAKSGQFADNARGASMDLSGISAPTFASLGNNKLVLDFDIQLVNGNGIAGLTLTGFGNPTITSASTTLVPSTWYNAKIMIDNSGAYSTLIYDANDKLTHVYRGTTSSSALSTMTFYQNYSTVNLDNLKIYTTANAPLHTATISVADDKGTALSGVNMTIDNYVIKTGTTGSFALVLEPGTYSYTAQLNGYQGEGGTDSATGTFIVADSDITVPVKLNKVEYIPVPTDVTVTGGQLVASKPLYTNATNTQKFVVSTVLDQNNVAITDATTAWSIEPEVTGVSVDNQGVVTITKDVVIPAGERTITVNVVATVAKNNSSKKVVTPLTISDYLFYEPGVGASSFGASSVQTIAGEKVLSIPSTIGTSTVTLPEPIQLKNGTAQTVDFKLAMTNKAVFTFERSIDFKSSTGTSLFGKLYVVNNDLGLNASGNSSNWTMGTVLGEIPALDKWVDVNMFIKTDAQGVSTLTMTIGGRVSAPITIESAKDLATIDFYTGANTDRYFGMKDIVIDSINIVGVEAVGADHLTKIHGQTVTSTYEYSAMILEDGETFTWAIEGQENSENVYENGAFNYTSEQAGEAVAFVVSYNSDGSLKTVQINPITLVAGENSISVTAENSDRIMLWDGLATQVPLMKTIRVNNMSLDGIQIDAQTGVLSVADTADTGVITISVTSDINPQKNAKIDVTINDFATVQSFSLNGPVVVSNGETVQYTVSDIIDQYGDVVSMVPTFAITDGVELASIDAETGVVTTNTGVNGSFTVSATLGNPEKELTVTKTVSMDLYTIIKDVDSETTDIDLTELVKDEHITGYLVTTSSNGELVQQYTENKVDSISVDTTGADKVEVSPIFEYTNVGNIPNGKGLTINIPEAAYTFTFKKGATERADIYVNGLIVGNNVDQYGETRQITEGATYKAEAIIVKGGSATVSMQDNSSNMTSISFVKDPSIVDRKTRVYLLGDSLVAEYYGTPTIVDENGIPVPGNGRTGWGQVLENFLSDDIAVSNLAESGSIARGLMNTVYHTVLAHAQPGDYLLIEPCYNDANPKNETTRTQYAEYLTTMITGAREKGIIPILVTPNASDHTYGESITYSSTMREVANDTNTMLVDLNKESHTFFETKYEGNRTTIGKNYNLYNQDGTSIDRLHSSYVGAMKFAEIVAQGIADLQADGNTDADGLLVNKEYKFSFTDTLSNVIEMQVKDKLSD